MTKVRYESRLASIDQTDKFDELGLVGQEGMLGGNRKKQATNDKSKI